MTTKTWEPDHFTCAKCGTVVVTDSYVITPQLHTVVLPAPSTSPPLHWQQTCLERGSEGGADWVMVCGLRGAIVSPALASYML